MFLLVSYPPTFLAEDLFIKMLQIFTPFPSNQIQIGQSFTLEGPRFCNTWSEPWISIIWMKKSSYDPKSSKQSGTRVWQNGRSKWNLRTASSKTRLIFLSMVRAFWSKVGSDRLHADADQWNSKWQWPKIEGLFEFKGKLLHSAKW